MTCTRLFPPPKKNDHAAGEKSTNLWNNHLSSYAGGQGFHRNVTQRGCVQLCREKSGEILAVFRPVGNKTASWTLKVDDDFWEGGRGGIIGNCSQEHHGQRRQHSPEELRVFFFPFGFNMCLDGTTTAARRERCAVSVCSSHRDRGKRERQEQRGGRQ